MTINPSPPPYRPVAPLQRGGLPCEPVGYESIARGPGHTRWRPVAHLGLAIAFYGILNTVVSIAMVVPLTLKTRQHLFNPRGGTTEVNLTDYMAEFLKTVTHDPDLVPWFLLLLNLSWAVAIPAVMLALWLSAKVKPGYASSVAGRYRWGWFARISAWLVPLWAGLHIVLLLLDPKPFVGPSGTGGQIAFLVIVVALATPLQTAGEEYMFRGLPLQTIPTWFKRREVGLAVATLVSAVIFSLMHMSLDPWVLLSVAAMAVSACWMTWRTGGLEAAIAMHMVNNLAAYTVSISTGTLESAFIYSGVSGTVGDFLQTALLVGLAALVVEWQARRHKIQTKTMPAS